MVMHFFNKITGGSVYLGYSREFGWVVISSRDFGLPSYHYSKSFGDDLASANKYFYSLHDEFVRRVATSPTGVWKVEYRDGRKLEDIQVFWDSRLNEWRFVEKVEEKLRKERKLRTSE
jgi:hypothetical protein